MKKLRVGIFGASRGVDIAQSFIDLGCDVTALVDNHEMRRNYGLKRLEEMGNPVTAYEDFDAFIEHGLDIVVLANFFFDHAKYAIKCFERGIHVFSECISNGTMAEGVELVRAFEKSNSIYMLGENYPQMLFNREIKRVCDGGTLGQILFAEGEYNHPSSSYDTVFKKFYNYFPEHWRHYTPRTYYITHSLGPIMWATGATPKKVTAFAAFAPAEPDAPIADNNGDRVANITTQNDDGSIFRVFGCGALGGHHNAYRVCGTNGQIENLRDSSERVLLRYNHWSCPEGAEDTQIYKPEWNDKDEDLIKKSGHGGGDYLTVRNFLDCIREGRQPEHPFNVYSATVMSSVAILGHRSVLNGGMPYDIPDFRLEECRKQYENDRETPYIGTDGSAPTIPCCSHTDYKATEEQLKNYKELMKDFVY